MATSKYYNFPLPKYWGLGFNTRIPKYGLAKNSYKRKTACKFGVSKRKSKSGYRRCLKNKRSKSPKRRSVRRSVRRSKRRSACKFGVNKITKKCLKSPRRKTSKKRSYKKKRSYSPRRRR